MKKFFINIILFSAIFLISYHQMHAQVLVTDGNIGAVMHITPKIPIANQQSTITLEFRDAKNIFTLKKCNCDLFINENGKNIYRQTLLENDEDPISNNAHIVFTFPQKDIYQVIITGKSKSDNTFASFTLNYNIHVDASPLNSNFLTEHLIQFIVIGIGITIIISLFVIDALPKRMKRNDIVE